MPNFGVIRTMIIEDYIGKDIYNSVHPLTRKELIKMGLEKFRAELIRVYGSMNNYNKWWLRNRKHMTSKQYRQELAEKHDLFSYGYLEKRNRLERENKLEDYEILNGKIIHKDKAFKILLKESFMEIEKPRERVREMIIEDLIDY